MTRHFVHGTSRYEMAPEGPDDQPLPAGDSSPYVLVVDDESVVRDFLARCLEGWGYATKKAGNAAEGEENKPSHVTIPSGMSRPASRRNGRQAA